MAHEAANFLARAYVPQAERFILAARQGIAAVGRKSGAIDRAGVFLQVARPLQVQLGYLLAPPFGTSEANQSGLSRCRVGRWLNLLHLSSGVGWMPSF